MGSFYYQSRYAATKRNPSRYAATKPTKKDLEVVADCAGSNWRSLLISLGIPRATRQSIEPECPTNLWDACMKGLVIWLKGGASDSDEPVTFDTLFAALKELGMRDCVSLLEDWLDERSTPHPRPTHEDKDEDPSTPPSKRKKPLSHGVDPPTEHLSAEQDTSPSEQPPDQTSPDYRFVIMVANDNELHATMHFLGSTLRSKVTEDAVKKCTYEGDENLKKKIKTEDSFNTEGTYRLKFYPITVCEIPGVVVKCGSMGSFSHMGSHRTTLQLMKEATSRSWKLNTIFIVGCCGTRPEIEENEQGTRPEIEENEQGTRPEIEENEQGVSESPSPEKAKRIVSKPAVPHAKSNKIVPIGTVLVAKEIFQYAMGKLKDGAIEWTPLCCSPPDLFVDLDAVQYGDEGSDECRIVKKVEGAAFLSGDFVVKGKDTASELGDLQRRPYVGFEMEGVGVIKAIDDALIFSPNKPPKVVLVKGVSDKAGWDKNVPCAIQFFHGILKSEQKVEEDARQQMCTIMSLTLVLKYIIQNKAIYAK